MNQTALSARQVIRFLSIIIIATLSAAPLAHSADSDPAYSFLNIPSSATAYGLGGINLTNIYDDVNNIDQNPALLGPELEMQLGMNYMHYIGGSNFAGVKFAHPAGDRAAWAAGIQYLGYGEIKGTDVSGNLTGTFSPKDVVVNAMYSHDLNDRWRGGINLKWVYSNYDQYTALAVATDLGVNYYDPERDLSLSVVAANLGGQIKRFNDSYDRLPIDLRVGWAQSFGTLPMRFSVTAWNLTKWHLPYYDTGDGTEAARPELKESFKSNLFRHLIFGVDFVPSQNFHIGVGYNYKTRTDMSTYSRSLLSGFSVGASMRTGRFGIGVALSQPHTGATTIMLNLSTVLSEFMQ